MITRRYGVWFLALLSSTGGAAFLSSTCGEGSAPSETLVVSARGTGSAPAGHPYRLEASVNDSTDGPWSYTIEWGDGDTTTGNASGAAPIVATHAYTAEGRYDIAVAVQDPQSGLGRATTSVTVSAPVLLLAGDIGDCQSPGDERTAALLDAQEGVIVTLGDNAYPNGTADEFQRCYEPSWGRHKARTRPVPGNHDYYTPGAAGYYRYFGPAAGDPARGYYAFTLGSWRVLVLNSGTERPAFMATGSLQDQWLRAELAAAPQQCVLALWHHPRFSIDRGHPAVRPEAKPLWDALYEFGADLIVNGHDHSYQRFAPQRPDGTPDPRFGIRQLVVGTGGTSLYDFRDPVPAVEAYDNTTWGILSLTLRPGGYDWQFLPVPGGSFTDSGSGTCHGRP